MSFVKLSSSITRSTIWDETPETCKLWITVLALSDPSGYVASSLPGLAREARLTIEQTEQSLLALCSPDPFSRSPEQEGRRLEKVDGGWFVINFRKYWESKTTEEKRQADRERQRRHRLESASRFVTHESRSVTQIAPVTLCHEKSPGEERRGEESEDICEPSGSRPSQPSLSSEASEAPKAPKATKERRPPVITETHRRLGSAWEHEQRETWGISVGAALTVRRNREALDAAAAGRTEDEADAVVRAYVRLPDPYLRQRGHPLSLLVGNLPAALVALRGDTGSGIDPSWKIPPRLT